VALVSSTYTLGVPQVDGRVPVTENHVDSNGSVYTYEYLNDGLDPQAVLQARASHINETLNQRQAIAEQIAGSPVAITPYEFLMRFTAAERIGIYAARASNAVVDDFLRLLDSAYLVRLYNARPGLAYLVSVNLLTQARADVIGAD
jgi:hypothetical protein